MSFGCELAYRASEPAVIMLHVEAARIASHSGLVDALRIVPELQRDSAATPLSENRETASLHRPAPAYTRTADAVRTA